MPLACFVRSVKAAGYQKMLYFLKEEFVIFVFASFDFMSREQVKKKIETLDNNQLALLSLFLQQLDEKKINMKQAAYTKAVQKARNALAGLKGSLSDDILAGRDERI
jgi:hypothetical protein